MCAHPLAWAITARARYCDSEAAPGSLLPSLFRSRLLNVSRSFFSCSFRYWLNSLKSRLPSLFWSPDDTIFCREDSQAVHLRHARTQTHAHAHAHALLLMHSLLKEQAKLQRPPPIPPPMALRGFTCAAPWRKMPIALRPARNSATSNFPSLLVSSLSNKSWYDLLLSASQHRACDSKNVRYIVVVRVEAAVE